MVFNITGCDAIGLYEKVLLFKLEQKSSALHKLTLWKIVVPTIKKKNLIYKGIDSADYCDFLI